MKLLLIALCMLAAKVAGECNNMCSGHGVCGANDACTCYRNWQGNDCSQRVCQFGVSFVTSPQGDLNHNGAIDDRPRRNGAEYIDPHVYVVYTLTAGSAITSTGTDNEIIVRYNGASMMSSGGFAFDTTTRPSSMGFISTNDDIQIMDNSAEFSGQVMTLGFWIKLKRHNDYAMEFDDRLLTFYFNPGTNVNTWTLTGVTQYQVLPLVMSSISATPGAGGDTFSLTYYPVGGGAPVTTASITTSATASTTATNVETALNDLKTAYTITDYSEVVTYGGTAVTTTGTENLRQQYIFIAFVTSGGVTINPILAQAVTLPTADLSFTTPSVLGLSWDNLVVTQASPKGTWESFPSTVDEEAHDYMECSNKGLCDRSTGECVCFPGYEGSACQRTVCPNACSGHGVCRNINDITESLPNFRNTPYILWDAKMTQQCVCDPGFGGVDCSMRLCPRNADPLVDDVVFETQRLAFTNTWTSGTHTFRLTYNDTFGESWTTSTITYHTTGATLASRISSALTSLPNGVIQAVTVNCPSFCDIYFTGTSGSITTGVAGNLNQLTVASLNSHTADTATAMSTTITIGSTTVTYGDGTSTLAISTVTQGTNTAEECSYRGLCNYDTGLCKCFRGYRTDDCHLQHALAY